MSWHLRLRGASAKTRRGAVALFDIVNLRRRQASSAHFCGRAYDAGAATRSRACVSKDRGRFVPPCLEMRARDCVRPPTRAALPAGGPFWRNEPTLRRCNRREAKASANLVSAAGALLFPVIYGGGLCCTRKPCSPAARQKAYASPSATKASRWCSAASGEKQQNTTRSMPRGCGPISPATVPTAMRAARSGGKR
jgi:hypothetical protein